MASTPPICDFGWQAPAFELSATDGQTYALSDVSGPKGCVVAFICNHCPYVLAVLDRIVEDAGELAKHGIGFAAICSNDAEAYPSDSFDNMRRMAETRGFPFPYLHDEDQTVARAYGAVCTPEFFGFNSTGGLQYRGRIDATRPGAPSAAADRDLFDAMVSIAQTGQGPREQVPSMGCSIKWRSA